jgi:hypothetical protein
MPAAEMPPEKPHPPAYDAERKIWFDYVVKLNDRSLQQTKVSGATTWGLLGVAVVILYKTVPLLPRLFSLPGILSSTSAMVLLETDAVLHLGAAFFYLLYYSIGGTEKRLLPRTAQRPRNIIFVASVVLMTALSFLHFLVSYKVSWAPSVRRCLFGFGIVWVANVGVAIGKRIKTAQKARKQKVPVPAFTGFELGADFGALLMAAVVFVAGIVPFCFLFMFLRRLNQASADWVTPLSLASHFVVLCGVLLVLFARAISHAPRAAYEALERAIVIENLSADEIRFRFVDQVLGPRAADWLRNLMKPIQEAEDQLAAMTESAKRGMAEIEAIDSQFPLERKGRAKKLSDGLHAALEEHKSAVEAFLFQIHHYPTYDTSSEEIDFLKAIGTDWRGEKGEKAKALVTSARQLKAELDGIAE